MPSYFKVFPQSMGAFRGSRGDPADHIYDMTINAGGQPMTCHVEVLFRAVNDMDLEEFFRGLETTAFWLPEMDTNDSEAILSLATNRVGRYPEPDDRPDGAPAAYSGVFGDANAPIIGSWFHTRLYAQRRPGDVLFRQPGGFSANAENMDNLRKIRPDYYAHMASQLDPADVRRLVENRPGYGRLGQPVYPDFDEETHVARSTLPVDPHQPIIIGVDAGSNAMEPSAIFLQRNYAGQWRALAELFLDGEQMGLEAFAHEVRRIAETRFRAAKGAVISVDPAAAGGNALSQYSSAQLLQQWTGIEVQLAPSQRPEDRRGALGGLLKRMVAPREPAFISDPANVGLNQGLSGGFFYPKRGNARSPSPAKNKFSHPVEAAEYAILLGEGLGSGLGGFIRPDGDGAHDAPKIIYGD